MNSWHSRIKEFDEEVSSFLNSSRKFRASCRSRSIVILLDVGDEVYDVLKFVAEQCDADLNIYRFDEAYNALRFIDTSGCDNVRCMIVDAKIILEQNGGLMGKLEKRFPGVPIFVKGWSGDQFDDLRKIHHVSLLPQEIDARVVAETLGVVA